MKRTHRQNSYNKRAASNKDRLAMRSELHTSTSVSIPINLLEQVTQLAKSKGQSRSAWIVDALQSKVKKETK